MIGRVSSSAINSTLVGHIQNNYLDFSKLTEQLSTGKKINSILDDTLQSVNIINSNSLI